MSQALTDESSQTTVPKHIAIIMDGNNRWAKSKYLPGVAGHKAGATAVRKTVEASIRSGVEVLTLFAFSSENWKRPKAEVDALMTLFMRALKKEVKRLKEHQIRLRVIGDVSGFSPALQAQIAKSEKETIDNTGMHLVIAANYGGRWDITNAVKQLCHKVAAGDLAADDIDEQMLASGLQLADLPDPDLLIRTSGEERISNFLLWQIAYSECVFLPVLWPDFDEKHFEEAITIFQNRQRRYGGR